LSQNIKANDHPSPKMKRKNEIHVICSKKDSKDSSFCNVHKKVHSGKKGEGKEPKLTGKIRRKLLSTKEPTNDWKCDVCDLSFNTREKFRDHRREVKCKRRVVCKNKQRSVDLPVQEDQRTIPFPEDLLTLPESGNLFPAHDQITNSQLRHFSDEFSHSLEQSSYSHTSDISVGSFSMLSKRDNELVDHFKDESVPNIDKSSKFSTLLHNSLVSTSELFNENSEKQSKDETRKSRFPRRLELSDLVSSQIPSTEKQVMSPFEAKFNTSPVRKQLIMKCCPKNSTLRRCCLKLDKSGLSKVKDL
jgi:hypothetical protein